MRLNYIVGEIALVMAAKTWGDSTKMIENVVYDSRKIVAGDHCLFLCLRTENQDGHQYIADAYKKGVRVFLVDKMHNIKNYDALENLTFIVCDNTLEAMQLLASFHRNRFDIPVIAITGSAGKTIVKEWLSQYLGVKFKVTKSPKSFNSQLGVAISLMEIDNETEVAIIEAGISLPGEMRSLKNMIHPTHGVFTSIGENHLSNFKSADELLAEKCVLFEGVTKVYLNEQFKDLTLPFSGLFGDLIHSDIPKGFTLIDRTNVSLCERVALDFGLSEKENKVTRSELRHIHLRLETLDGINDTKLILDAYNRTIDGLDQALGYQATIAQDKCRILIVHNSDIQKINKDDLKLLLSRYNLEKQEELRLNFSVYSNLKIDSLPKADQLILLKGNHPETLSLGNQWKKRKHQTFVEISLDALAYNLKQWRSHLKPDCKILAMVKASSYGTEIGELGKFLEQQKVSSIGVAYADEGVLLRKQGVRLPVLVMNSDRYSWEDCLAFDLEPSIFSLDHFKDFLSFVEEKEVIGVRIHLKFDTGMHRLGFLEKDLPELISLLQTSKNILISSVFSHLADAGNPDAQFTLEQLAIFDRMTSGLTNQLAYPIHRHILNSDGASLGHVPSYDMIRLGIGLYGISSHPSMVKKLQAVLQWKSVVSQVKTLEIGETVGYGRTFIAEKPMNIAIIPVGYADGFKRSLSQGKGGVWIHNEYCPVVGNVCMDMIIVAVSPKVSAGDVVEIIGENQTVQVLANCANTIPYEIMTGLSTRMPRVFVQHED
ncbi:MAG: alanine racemase [Bacteroidetes bacterium]|nr:alanine racemase [Bacteroidota bacterium]